MPRWRRNMDRRSRSSTSRSTRFSARCCRKVDENTTLLVLSDHGFAPYRHSFNLNTWLLNNATLPEKRVQWRVASRFPTWIGDARGHMAGAERSVCECRGREREGIVDPEQADSAAAGNPQSCWKCAIRGEFEDERACDYPYDLASVVYQGPTRARGRMRWLATTGVYRAGMEDDSGCVSGGRAGRQTRMVSGDHCMDFTRFRECC